MERRGGGEKCGKHAGRGKKRNQPAEFASFRKFEYNKSGRTISTKGEERKRGGLKRVGEKKKKRREVVDVEFCWGRTGGEIEQVEGNEERE